jgi:hypothetical protein
MRFILLFILLSSSCGFITISNNSNNGDLLHRKFYNLRNSNNFLSFPKLISVDSTFFGVAGLLALLLNRIQLETVSDVQSRSDIIGVMSCSALLLNLISEKNIDAKSRQPVALYGHSLKSPIFFPDLKYNEKYCITWIMDAIMETKVVTSVCIIKDFDLIGAVGVVATPHILKNFKIENKPILKKVLHSNEEIYLPDLQVTCIYKFIDQ